MYHTPRSAVFHHNATGWVKPGDRFLDDERFLVAHTFYLDPENVGENA
jgi:hypothetical protein